MIVEWKFWLAIIAVLAAIGLVAALLISSAIAADNDVPCLTKEQAKAKYPGMYLYWRTAKRCWYGSGTRASATAAAIKSKPATWGKQNSLKLPKPSPDANGNVIHHSGRAILEEPKSSGPNVFYPSLMAGTGTSDDMLYAGSMNTWPLIVDFDVEPPLFIPWNERVSTMFDQKQ